MGIEGGVGRLEDTVVPSANPFGILRRLAIRDRLQQRREAEEERVLREGEDRRGMPQFREGGEEEVGHVSLTVVTEGDQSA